MGNGYEYFIVGHCKRTGKPFLKPIAWSNPKKDPPVYATCPCCSKKGDE